MAWMTHKSGTLANGETFVVNLAGDSQWFCFETDIAGVLTSSLDNATYGTFLDHTGANKGVLTANGDPRILPQYPYIKFTAGGTGVITVCEWVRDPA
jgi:hypothetical protein